MQYQVQTRYNVTAQRSNNTMTDSYRLTVAWDSLQTEVSFCSSVCLSVSLSVRLFLPPSLPHAPFSSLFFVVLPSL